jgi:hypothetical protein
MTSRTEAAVYAARLEERAHQGPSWLQDVGQ